MNDEHIVEINGHRFKYTWSSVIQVGITAVALVGLYYTTRGTMEKHDRNIAELFKRSEQAQVERQQMDREGTRRSHEIDAMQQQTLDDYGKRLAEIEKWGPIIQKIDANVLWLMGKQLESNKR